MYNKQSLIGNLGADADIRPVGENRRVVKLSVASAYRYLNNKNEEVTHTEWFKVELFCSEKQAAYFEKNFKKGALAFAEGRTHTETYTAHGEQQTSRVVKCDVDDVRLLKAAHSEQSTNTSTGNRQAQPDARPSNQKTTAPASTLRSDLMDFDA